MKINMTIDECIEFAREWSRGMTIHEGSQGWRVVCMLLADEVVRLRGGVKIPDGWKLVPVICTPEIEAVYANDTGAYQTAQELHDAMLNAMTNTRTPSATVKFYDMQDGAVETEVDMHEGYAGTNAQKMALRFEFHYPEPKKKMPCGLDNLP